MRVGKVEGSELAGRVDARDQPAGSREVIPAFDPGARGERDRRAVALADPGGERVGVPRTAKELAEQVALRVAREDAAKALPVL